MGSIKGELSQNAITGASGTPAASRPATTGTTPQEQKGESAPAEVQRAEWAITQLGGQMRRLLPVELLGLAETRYLVLLDKIAATPPQYPRRPGIPTKRPLMEKGERAKDEG